MTNPNYIDYFKYYKEEKWNSINDDNYIRYTCPICDHTVHARLKTITIIESFREHESCKEDIVTHLPKIHPFEWSVMTHRDDKT